MIPKPWDALGRPRSLEIEDAPHSRSVLYWHHLESVLKDMSLTKDICWEKSHLLNDSFSTDPWIMHVTGWPVEHPRLATITGLSLNALPVSKLPGYAKARHANYARARRRGRGEERKHSWIGGPALTGQWRRRLPKLTMYNVSYPADHFPD